MRGVDADLLPALGAVNPAIVRVVVGHDTPAPDERKTMTLLVSIEMLFSISASAEPSEVLIA